MGREGRKRELQELTWNLFHEVKEFPQEIPVALAGISYFLLFVPRRQLNIPETRCITSLEGGF